MSNVIPVKISTILKASDPINRINIHGTTVHIVVVLGEILEITKKYMTISDESGKIRQFIN